MKAEICCNYIFSRRTGNKTGIRKQRKRLEKVEWYKICMRIGAETIFKEVLPSVWFLVYVLFYLVKGPVGINKGKKMEHFRLERKHFISFSFSRSIISLDRWVQSQLMVTFVCTKSLTHLQSSYIIIVRFSTRLQFSRIRFDKPSATKRRSVLIQNGVVAAGVNSNLTSSICQM